MRLVPHPGRTRAIKLNRFERAVYYLFGLEPVVWLDRLARLFYGRTGGGR